MKHLGLKLGMVFNLLFTPAFAQPDFLVEKVVVAKEVDQKNPKEIFSPPAYCEKDKNGQAAIPIIHASQTPRVFYWTKVKATTSGTLHHSWHHRTNGVWEKVSVVSLSVKPSSGYRMWSLKSLNPDIHTGEWMVVVAPSHEPERILCITRFTVK